MNPKPGTLKADKSQGKGINMGLGLPQGGEVWCEPQILWSHGWTDK